MKRFVLLIAASVLASAGSVLAADFAVADELIENSRGGASQVVLYYPEAGDGIPLVVMAHGHGGELTEAGGFDAVAERLAQAGVASVRVQFPGSGSSTEEFTVNNLPNMLDDLEAARTWALGTSPAADSLDAANTGILGYSMGGRLAMLAAGGGDAYNVVALWAPAATNGVNSLHNLFGSEDAFLRAWAEAELDGQYDFVTPWGGVQTLSRAWFDELAASEPETVFADFTGPVFVAWGDEDVIVEPAVAAAAVAAAGSDDVTTEVIEGADHGFGFFDGFTEQSEQVVDLTVSWLLEQLR